MNKKDLLNWLPARSRPRLQTLRIDAMLHESHGSRALHRDNSQRAGQSSQICDSPVASQGRLQPYSFSEAILAWKSPLRCILVFSRSGVYRRAFHIPLYGYARALRGYVSVEQVLPVEQVRIDRDRLILHDI
jgi:hypothetical protein